MFKLKVVLLLAANCMLTVSCLDSEETVNGPHGAEIKINWGPVWDDNEGNHEFVTRNSAGASEEDSQQHCKAPNGLGLQNLFLEAQKLLPKQQIRDIVKSYSEDAEIKALKAFVANPQTIDKVKAIYNSQEYQILKDYACRVLHIDLNKYNRLARSFLKPLTRTSSEPRQGIRGLIDELQAVIPRQQLRDLYKKLLASDEELVKAVANLKSDEFHQLLLNVKTNVPEYKILRQQLIDLGVPVEEMGQLLANTFGWAPELGLLD